MDVRVLQLVGQLGGEQAHQTCIYKIFTDLNDRVLKLESNHGGFTSQSLSYPLLTDMGLPRPAGVEPGVTQLWLTGTALVAHLQRTYPEQNLQLTVSQQLTLPASRRKPYADRRCIATFKRSQPRVAVA